MQGSDARFNSDVLDAAQLKRIEAVHRGFLYQHLYAVGCLLLAQKASVDSVMVELDEDIELNSEVEKIYVQVKTRSKPFIISDLSGVLERFEDLRKEHNVGKRKGSASFVIVANHPPGPMLKKYIDESKLPSDVIFHYPKSTSRCHPALPPAWSTLDDAATWCIAEAGKLNFSLLSPESLIWKMAGLVQLAATGTVPNKQHVFHTQDLSQFFEQCIVQLQNFPTPPEFYRPQKHEPSLVSNEHTRIICGLSGAGKTAWAAQAAIHTSELSAYYDTGDLPGPALASTLVRELAAKFSTPDNAGDLRKVLLPGASGIEALRIFDTFLEKHQINMLLVLDNAHRIPVVNLRDVLNASKHIRFVLLCQPHNNVSELEAVTGVQRETLLGWDLDTVAAVVHGLGGFASANGYEQLRTYTGGLPLYVESAAKIAAAEYGGNVDQLCIELKQQENSVETAQEIILERVYRGFETQVQNALALFSLSDVALSREEVFEFLSNSLTVSKSGAAALLRKMRSTGTIEVYGNQALKVHDAVRVLGLLHFELLDPDFKNRALLALKDLLITGLNKTQDTSRFSLLTQIYIRLNDVMTLIALSGEELFYEMGITVDILARLEHAAASVTLEPIHKFWALDGLVFSDIREGRFDRIPKWFDVIESILAKNQLSYREDIAYTMKRILFAAENKDRNEVQRLVKLTLPKLSDPEHQRIFDYNHAIALWKMRKYKDAENLCSKVISQYYELIGMSPREVIGKNADVLWSLINKTENIHEHLKHLADVLELFTKVREQQGKATPFARIHAMKFYNMVNAPESMVRVGQDLVDEFVGMKDYEGARQVMEQHVLPVVNKVGLLHRMVQVRSQYAVVLALSGFHDDADAEMKRLNPYFDGLNALQRKEIENQSNYIAYLANQASKTEIAKQFGFVTRNGKCPCGSGLKYKKCHGT